MPKLIKLEFSRLTTAQKVGYAQQVAQGLDGNPHVLTPEVTPEELTAAALALQNAEIAISIAEQAVTTKVNLRDEAAETLLALMEEGANDVEAKTGGDKTKILTTNFRLRETTGGEVGPLPAPQGLYISPGDEDGELDAVCEPVRGRQFFEWQAKEEGTDTWVTKVTDTPSKASIKDLTSGKRYRVRVRAKGAAGYSPWSDETSARTAP